MSALVLPSYKRLHLPGKEPPASPPLTPVMETLLPPLNPTVITDGAGLEKLRQYLSRVDIYALDYETNMVRSIFERRARTLQIGDRNEQYIIDLMAIAGSKEALIGSQGNFGRIEDPRYTNLMKPVIDVVGPSMDSRKYLKLGHNLEFEYMVSRWAFGIRLWNLWCTQTVEKLLWAGKIDFFGTNFWGLEDIVARREALLIEKGVQKQDWLKEEPLNETDIAYCALDCRLPFAIRRGQLKDVAACKIGWTVEIENNAIPAIGDIKLHGFKQDEVAWRKLKQGNEEELAKAIAEMDTHALPIYGSKHNEPDPQIVADLEKTWKEFNLKTPEEEALGEKIRKCKRSPEGVAEKEGYKAERAELEKARKAKRDEAKKISQAATKAFNKFHKDKDSWEGNACINYNSNPQLREFLLNGKFGFYEKEGKDRHGNVITKTNLPSTDDGILEKFADKPIVKAIRRYRRYKKLIGTYGEKWLRLTTDPDGGFTDPFTFRLHSDIIQIGADTGRSSSREPNFFNLPKQDEYRACFIARPGCKICTIDMNGAELRILAELSQEPAWVQAFNKGWDVHSVCAELLYGERWKVAATETCAYYHPSDKHPDAHQKCKCSEHETLRQAVKAINFGLAYGMSARKLAAELEISLEDAELLLKKYAQTFKVLWKYLEETGRKAFWEKLSRTIDGRRRILEQPTWDELDELCLEDKWMGPKIKAENRKPTSAEKQKKNKAIAASIERQGKNTPIQGTNASMIKMAIGCGFDADGTPYMWHRLEPDFNALLENLIYDEVVIEAPDETAQAAYDWAADCIVRAGNSMLKTIPMLTDGHIDVRWRK